jgi:hypothetical protein
MLRIYLKNGETFTIQALIYQIEQKGEFTFFNFYDSEYKPITYLWLTTSEVASIVPVAYLVKEEG